MGTCIQPSSTDLLEMFAESISEPELLAIHGHLQNSKASLASFFQHPYSGWCAGSGLYLSAFSFPVGSWALPLAIVGAAGQAATCAICRTLFLGQLKLCLHLLALLLNPFRTSPTLDNASFLFLCGACIVLMDFFSSGMFKDQLLYLHRLHCLGDCRGSNVN